MVSFQFDPKIKSNLFAQGVNGVAFRGGNEGGAPVEKSTGVEQYGTGKGINGLNSNGFLGEVTGTGDNGKHKLDMYM